jgi:hypothetical protein
MADLHRSRTGQHSLTWCQNLDIMDAMLPCSSGVQICFAAAGICAAVVVHTLDLNQNHMAV